MWRRIAKGCRLFFVFFWAQGSGFSWFCFWPLRFGFQGFLLGFWVSVFSQFAFELATLCFDRGSFRAIKDFKTLNPKPYSVSGDVAAPSHAAHSAFEYWSYEEVTRAEALNPTP